MRIALARNPRWLAACALGVTLTLLGAGPTAASGGAAERLARSQYFDSIPFDEVRALDAAGAARLRALLADPAELEHHAQILEFIGIRGGPGAYEAIAACAARIPVGDVDGNVYRARLAIPIALGHLARSDDRALAELVLAATREAGEPGWAHGRQRGARLERQQRELALMGLALSGQRHARALLVHLARDPELGRSADAARRLAERVAAEGAAAVFRDRHGEAASR